MSRTEGRKKQVETCMDWSYEAPVGYSVNNKQQNIKCRHNSRYIILKITLEKNVFMFKMFDDSVWFHGVWKYFPFILRVKMWF